MSVFPNATCSSSCVNCCPYQSGNFSECNNTCCQTPSAACPYGYGTAPGCKTWTCTPACASNSQCLPGNICSVPPLSVCSVPPLSVSLYQFGVQGFSDSTYSLSLNKTIQFVKKFNAGHDDISINVVYTAIVEPMYNKLTADWFFNNFLDLLPADVDAGVVIALDSDVNNTPLLMDAAMQTMLRFVGSINFKSTSKKFTSFAIDSENGIPCSWVNIRTWINQYVPDIKYTGLAGAVANAKLQPEVDNNIYETYWNMNELGLCHPRITPVSDFCTTLSPYAVFKNQPEALLAYLVQVDGCALNNAMKLIKSAAQPPIMYPTFSFENRSNPACLSPKCGVFDGFGAWDLEAFVTFVKLFAALVGVQHVGFYESQFLPLAWLA